MADKILIKRTEGTDPPAELEFGELAFADGADTVFVGKANGSALPIGSSTPPSLADVAYSGSYDDLTDQPIIPTIPTLADVAYSGSYDDLANKPIIPAGVSDRVPAPGTEYQTNKFYPSGVGFKPVWRRWVTIATPYPSNSYLARAHGIAGIETICDYALFYRGAGYLYKVVYNELSAGVLELALFGLTDWIWGSARNKNSDGTTTEGAWWEIEYTKLSDSIVIF